MVIHNIKRMNGTKVLIADDEVDILDLLEYNLQKAGFTVIRAHNGEEAIALALKEKPNLILLDVMMPRMDGISACHHIREIPSLKDTSIVILTARSEEYSELAGFEAGADDYIFKPIRPRALVKRLNAILRRKRSVDERIIKIHDLEINRDEYMVKKGANSISLPRKEFELFFFMASRPGKVFRREELLTQIWENIHVTDRTVDVHIRKLRSKLGNDYIQTVKGVGYKFLPVER